MLLNVKIIGGDGCSVDVEPDITVLELKKVVQKSLKVDTAMQKLLLKGRPLTDSRKLSDYGIEEGFKLNLMINKDPKSATMGSEAQAVDKPTTSTAENSGSKNVLFDELVRFLRRHFKEADVQRIAAEYMKAFNASYSQCSLEDWERIATQHLNSTAKSSNP